MILANDYWYDIVPAAGPKGSIDGKWLIFGPTEQLHAHLTALDSLVEGGQVKAAKIARKLPDIDPFPEKPCVICVFTANDESEKKRVKTILENNLGASPVAWKSNLQTERDWAQGGWLSLQAESNRLRRDIERGAVTDLSAAKQRLAELTDRINSLAKAAPTPDREAEVAIGNIQAAANPNHSNGPDNSLTEIVARLERIETAIASRLLSETPNKMPIGEPQVFVVMPFAEEYEDAYLAIKRAAATAREGVYVHRVDEHPGAIAVTDEIHRSIETAAVVVCDLTAERPNVYYELGFARGLGKPMLCIAKEGTKLHFDVAGLKVIFFKTYGRLEQMLTRELGQLLPTAPENK